MRGSWRLFLLVAAASSTLASAKNFGEHGGYEVVAIEGTSESDRGGCVMAEDDFEGPGGTRLRIFRFIAHPEVVAVTIDNYNWTAKKGESYQPTYSLDDKYYEREAQGTVDSIYRGFMAFFPEEEFMSLLAGSNNLHIHKGETVVDKLSLQGSAAGRAAFERCWTYLLADDRAKAKERARWQDIPKDPFAE